jgi:hypothetical protein
MVIRSLSLAAILRALWQKPPLPLRVNLRLSKRVYRDGSLTECLRGSRRQGKRADSISLSMLRKQDAGDGGRACALPGLLVGRRRSGRRGRRRRAPHRQWPAQPAGGSRALRAVRRRAPAISAVRAQARGRRAVIGPGQQRRRRPSTSPGEAWRWAFACARPVTGLPKATCLLRSTFPQKRPRRFDP